VQDQGREIVVWHDLGKALQRNDLNGGDHRPKQQERAGEGKPARSRVPR
jgi:hypothetical protein